MSNRLIPSSLYGLMAEFKTGKELVAAASRVREAGYEHFDAYSPYPIHGLTGVVEKETKLLPVIVFLAGLGGGVGGFAMQYIANVIHFPLIIGGKPYDSWPAFIPITFELTILGASLAAVVGMIVLNGLPEPYHPVFNVPRFAEAASRDGFFLVVEAKDSLFDQEETREFLQQLSPIAVNEVPA